MVGIEKVSMVEGTREPSGVSFIRVSIPFMKAPSSRPSQLPKTPPPKYPHLGARFQHRHFGDTNSVYSKVCSLMCSKWKRGSVLWKEE